MAYILHIIDATEVSTPQATEQFIAEQSPKPPFLNPKFANFTALITSNYPDLSEEDLDGDNDENIWEEGINGNMSSGNLKNITVKSNLLDELLMAAIARAAIAAELQLYDDEGQVLYH
ncbi:MAG: hypothetical protein HC889_07125 [Synechococcaceae cyanobacterium SM1_2_3]|nr:hypothetical protein [Synechococcaceae cyanobacterium SM1_2_3]